MSLFYYLFGHDDIGLYLFQKSQPYIPFINNLKGVQNL